MVVPVEDGLQDQQGRTRCPVDFTMRMVGGKWKPLILHRLSAGTLRFGQLKRSMPHVTQRMLTLQLRELERDGLLTRKVFPEIPPRVEYSLTGAALELMPVLAQLNTWMRRHEHLLRDDQPLQSVTEDEDEDDDRDEARSSR